jgi:hypothetical protein
MIRPNIDSVTQLDSGTANQFETTNDFIPPLQVANFEPQELMNFLDFCAAQMWAEQSTREQPTRKSRGKAIQ